MPTVSATDLRADLFTWLGRVREGEEVEVSSRGTVIARLVPPRELKSSAQEALVRLRERAVVGDVETPLDLVWEADRAPA